ncbi:GAF domain-containing protein [Desertivirga arenae]|uniref:GAF domain-containing protein n=1 Tax=Desertivirga arenae TaxID=2810309 RepID=UPI001A96C57D|nr:GAF domain-containing protein [Pedobacter sp. SYSU D00823]
MIQAEKEQKRLEQVKRFIGRNFEVERELTAIVQLAAEVCRTPTALITFLDSDTQYIRFKHGFNFDTTSRQDSFCRHVVDDETFMVVEDAKKDERFALNPLVTGNPHIRFYAGSPLTTSEGFHLGSLCVIDQLPGELTRLQKKTLEMLSKQVVYLLELDESLKLIREQLDEARRKENELRSFFESSIDNHLLISRDFEILAFNKTWARFVRELNGMIPEKGKLLTLYFPAEDYGKFYLDCKKALGGTAVFDEINLEVGGSDLWYLLKIEPAFNAEGEIFGLSVNFSDITSKVKHEKLSQQKSDSLESIAFIQAHELRRPVSSILGIVSLMKETEAFRKSDELGLLEAATEELDGKIHEILGRTNMK